MYRRALGKSTNKFIEEFFGAYLEVKSVTTVFDADVEELCDGELCVEWSGAAHRTLSARRATFWLR
jgi:hypothetical protein